MKTISGIGIGLAVVLLVVGIFLPIFGHQSPGSQMDVSGQIMVVTGLLLLAAAFCLAQCWHKLPRETAPARKLTGVNWERWRMANLAVAFCTEEIDLELVIGAKLSSGYTQLLILKRYGQIPCFQFRGDRAIQTRLQDKFGGVCDGKSWLLTKDMKNVKAWPDYWDVTSFVVNAGTSGRSWF